MKQERFSHRVDIWHGGRGIQGHGRIVLSLPLFLEILSFSDLRINRRLGSRANCVLLWLLCSGGTGSGCGQPDSNLQQAPSRQKCNKFNDSSISLVRH